MLIRLNGQFFHSSINVRSESSSNVKTSHNTFQINQKLSIISIKVVTKWFKYCWNDSFDCGFKILRNVFSNLILRNVLLLLYNWWDSLLSFVSNCIKTIGLNYSVASHDKFVLTTIILSTSKYFIYTYIFLFFN